MPPAKNKGEGASASGANANANGHVYTSVDAKSVAKEPPMELKYHHIEVLASLVLFEGLNFLFIPQSDRVWLRQFTVPMLVLSSVASFAFLILGNSAKKLVSSIEGKTLKFWYLLSLSVAWAVFAMSGGSSDLAIDNFQSEYKVSTSQSNNLVLELQKPCFFTESVTIVGDLPSGLTFESSDENLAVIKGKVSAKGAKTSKPLKVLATCGYGFSAESQSFTLKPVDGKVKAPASTSAPSTDPLAVYRRACNDFVWPLLGILSTVMFVRGRVATSKRRKWLKKNT